MATVPFSVAVPLAEPYDLVVCGGGPAGVAAAIAAGRNGLRTLLVESTGQLGGTGTNGGAARLLGGRTPNNRQWAVTGIFTEVVDRLVASGHAIHPEQITAEKYNPYGGTGYITSLGYGTPFDPLGMATLLDTMVREAGVDVLFFTDVVAVETKEQRIQHLVLSNKSGLTAMPATAFVDATGDADIAARAGCEFVKGRPLDGKMTPATLLFHVDRIDPQALRTAIYNSQSPRLTELIHELREQGHWPFATDVVANVQLTSPDTLLINATRLFDVDGTDGASVSRAMMAGRAEVQQLFAVMRAHFPGFTEARLRSVATTLGVRETRRIVGDFVFTAEDVIKGRNFPDTIGFSAYTWDLPDPETPHLPPPAAERKPLRRHTYTPLPYAILVPRPVTNLLCAGRCVSVDRDVLGIVRVQAPCYAMGQAAGTAAVQAVRDGLPFAKVDTAKLRKTLVEQGALVDWKYPPLPD